jgi:hypothetical protein
MLLSLLPSVLYLIPRQFLQKTDSDKCDLCGREQEDTFHLLFVCIHYRTERVNYVYEMSNYAEFLNRENYLVMLRSTGSSAGFQCYVYLARAKPLI